ncbi:MAG: hypothetical protein HZC41_25470 [Chloroflexi bacterium]|nr:hypothetical protein [Chloroflexota bacterium]
MSITAIIAIIMVLAAIITLLPRTSARRRCALGYKALCTFAPISTIMLLVIAAFVWLISSAG